jgi:hypothetical protein
MYICKMPVAILVDDINDASRRTYARVVTHT